MTAMITVLEAYESWNNQNVYTLHNNNEESIITKKPLMKGDRFSLSCESNNATFAQIRSGSDKCISVKVASTETTAPMMLLVNIKNVYDSWKTDKVGYFYQDKAIATIAYSAKSDKYQLVFDDSTKIVIDATVCIDKIAPTPAPAPNTTPAPAPNTTPAPAPAITVGIVYELAMQLPTVADLATLSSQINAAIAAKLSAPAPAPNTTPAPAPNTKLCKEFPVHYDRLVTWLENKYQGVEIKDILINWGDKEIQGIKKITDKEVAAIASDIEGQEIGPATIREELATICYLKALENGVLIPYLNKIGATVSDVLKKLPASKQLEAHKAILKRWEAKKINFATLNNACKHYSKNDPALVLKVMIGQSELPKKN